MLELISTVERLDSKFTSRTFGTKTLNCKTGKYHIRPDHKWLQEVVLNEAWHVTEKYITKRKGRDLFQVKLLCPLAPKSFW